MSRREEDEHKNACPGRGLAIAAAAVGVGVGAALYYFFSKQSENGEGSSADRATEQRHSFRQRSWSLEECTICYEVMLNDDGLVSLPCSHNFHTNCIKRWLEQHNTCPNCRLPAAES